MKSDCYEIQVTVWMLGVVISDNIVERGSCLFLAAVTAFFWYRAEMKWKNSQ